MFVIEREREREGAEGMNNRLRVAAISRHSADVDACFYPIKRLSQKDEAGRVASILVAAVWVFMYIVGKKGALVLQQKRWMRCRAELATHTTRVMNAAVALRQPPVDSSQNNCHMLRFNVTPPLKIRFNASLSDHLTCLRVQPSILIAGSTITVLDFSW